MNSATQDDRKSQLDKFEEVTRELATGDVEKGFDERVKKLLMHKLERNPDL